MNTMEGHRKRLRERYIKEPTSLTDAEILELLLTYAIPRRDVAPLARALIDRSGSFRAVLMATKSDLLTVEGIGEAAATFLKILGTVLDTQTNMTDSSQLKLFELSSSSEAQKTKSKTKKERSMRVFTNDEIANSLSMLPKVSEFKTIEAFKQYLNAKLPYNAAETRKRRAMCILDRFYPGAGIDTPLTHFISHSPSQEDLKAAIFYHILKAEPIATKVAEELIWPALPLGRIEREQMLEFVLHYLPDAVEASQNKTLRALFNTYSLLGVGIEDGATLRFQLHKGTLESFLYIFTNEFPQPGIFSFDVLYNGPIHRWMLWDREWIRQQLYNLHDFGILAKISEIDTVNQFTVAVDQSAAIRLFFEYPGRSQLSLREAGEEHNTNQEG